VWTSAGCGEGFEADGFKRGQSDAAAPVLRRKLAAGIHWMIKETAGRRTKRFWSKKLEAGVHGGKRSIREIGARR